MTRSSEVVRDLTLMLGLPFTLMVGLLIWWPSRDPGQAPAGGDLFNVVAGRWAAGSDLSSCAAAWHDIAFDSARARMAIRHPSGTTDEYLVQGHEPDRIIAQLVGDSTLDDAGTQVVWLLITTSDTSYVWRRRDWIPGHTTEPTLRCSASTVSTAIIRP
jgi:hypothetical protein